MTEIRGRLKAVGAWLKTGGRTVGAWLAAVFAWVWRPYRQWSRRRKLAAAVAGLLLGLVLADAVARAAWGAALRRWVAAGPVLGPLFFYDAGDAPAWKDRVTALALLFSAVIGYLLWHWRDVNARHTIENQRKDVNLKEFQEIQLRAAGALDRDKLGAETCDQLQIAALHQLRGFLRGEYGAAFQRPAFELLLAGHAIAMERNGMPAAIKKWADDKETKRADAQLHVQKAITEARRRLSVVDKERLNILRDEAKALIASGFPLTARTLDLVDWRGLQAKAADLSFSSMIGANLSNALLDHASMRSSHLEGASLWGAELSSASLLRCNLTGADMIEVRLERANLSWSRLDGADMSGAHLSQAILRKANLGGTDLVQADLRGASLVRAEFEEADLEGALFDNETAVGARRMHLTNDQFLTGQQKLRALGARHVDDPEEGDNEDAAT